MTSGQQYFSEYAAYHADRRNLICHEIGIPLIVLSLIALLRLVTLAGGSMNLAEIVLLALVAFYLMLGRAVLPSAAVAAVGLVALYLLAAYVTWPWAVAAFVAGWIFQFIGHAYEGKRPAFLDNLVHLLVGPLWVASHLVPSSSSSSAR